MRAVAASAASVLAFAWLSALAGVAFASPEDILGYGTRSPAMGGTGTAHSEGFEAVYTNPALLSRIREQKLTLGIEEASFDLHANGANLPGTIGYDPMKSIVIGVDVPIPLRGALTDRIGAGLALSTPTNLIVRGRIEYSEVPQFSLLPDRTQSVSVRAGLGIDLGWGIRIGAGFGALAQIEGSAVVATDATGKVGARVEDQLIATYSPTLGATFDLPFRDPFQEGAITRIGFTYRGALAARFDVTIDATKLSTLNIPVLNIAGMAQYDPSQMTFEIARTSRSLSLALGATLKHWSAYPGPLQPTLPCPSDDQGCDALTPPTVTYKNTFVPRVGAEYAIEASKKMLVHVRAGAFYEPSPLPSKLPSSLAYNDAVNKAVDVPTRYFDADRFVATVGYGIAFRDPLPPLTIDLFAQAHVLVPRTIESDAPNGATGPDNSVARVTGTVLAAGLLVGVTF
jgi:hypothetical protein